MWDYSIRVTIPQRNVDGPDITEKMQEKMILDAYHKIVKDPRYLTLPTQGRVEMEHEFYSCSKAANFEKAALTVLKKYEKKAG